MTAKRNLDHLDYDENLYDFMRFLIPFYITAQNKSINKHLLSEYGLEKNSFLNIHFNDTLGKNELVADLILSTILPKEWVQASNDDQSNAKDPIPIIEGQELIAVLIDVQGSFCARKFNEKLKQTYNKYELWKSLGDAPTERQITNDKHAFIK